jgi:hypothetical protein
MPSPGSSGNAGVAKDNSGCLLPFGALFAIVGAGMLLSALPPVRAHDTATRLLMAVIFGGAGTALMLWGIASRRATRTTAALARQHPDQPWLWREDWAASSANPESKSQFLTYILMGLVFVLVSAPALVNIPREIVGKHNYGILAALLFPLAGFGLMGYALLGRARARKFGAIFRMAQNPYAAGGHMRGRIETIFPLPPDQMTDLTLSCVRSYTTRSERERGEEVLWQEKARVPAMAGPLGSSLPVDFEVPFDMPETNASNSAEEVIWRLSAFRKLPGIDLRMSFQVPVFKTAASDPSRTVPKMEEENVARSPTSQPAPSRIRVSPDPTGGTRYYLGPARTKGVAAAMMLFGLICATSGSFFAFLSHGAFGWFVAALPILLGLGVGVLLLALSLWLWLATMTLRTSNGELEVESAFVGFARKKLVPASEIEKFALYPAIRAANQVWYDLRVYLRNGRKITAGSGLEKREAEWLAAELKRNLGLK